jgi:hypothetical protein
VAKAAERVCRSAAVRLFCSYGLCRLDVADVARPPLVVGEKLRQRFFDVRRRRHFGEPQWLGEPTSILEQAFGLFGHFALLEVMCARRWRECHRKALMILRGGGPRTSRGTAREEKQRDEEARVPTGDHN